MDRQLSERPPEWRFGRRENTRSSFREVFTPISYRYFETTLSPSGSESKPSGTIRRQEVRTSTIFSQDSIVRRRQSIVKCLRFSERWTPMLLESLRYAMRKELSRSSGSTRFRSAASSHQANTAQTLLLRKVNLFHLR